MSIMNFIKRHKVEIGIIGGTAFVCGLAILVGRDYRVLNDTAKFVRFIDEGKEILATNAPVTLDDIKDIQAVTEAYLVCKDPEYWYIIDAKPEDFVAFAAQWVG